MLETVNSIVQLRTHREIHKGKKVRVYLDEKKLAYTIQIDTSWQMGIEGNRNVQWLLINQGDCITNKMIMDDGADKLSYRQNLIVMELLNDETEDGLYQESKPNIINFVNDVILFQYNVMIEPHWEEGAELIQHGRSNNL